jgi:NAD(P)-dependent dehydrogenase (short-subunit alcohol dehydrogenase family)
MSNSNQRITVVIGGASGIGWATAQALAGEGDRVTVADRNADGAQGRVAELGEPHTASTVDVTDEASVQRFFEHTRPGRRGRQHSGVLQRRPDHRHAVDQFRDVIDVCLTGAFIVAKHAGRNLRSGGVLVSISSLNGRQPAAGMSAYCSAKAGLSMLTQVAALELGPRGIRVNAIAPGFVHTPLTEPAAAVPGVVEEYLENTALGRAGTPEASPTPCCTYVRPRLRG